MPAEEIARLILAFPTAAAMEAATVTKLLKPINNFSEPEQSRTLDCEVQKTIGVSSRGHKQQISPGTWATRISRQPASPCPLPRRDNRIPPNQPPTSPTSFAHTSAATKS